MTGPARLPIDPPALAAPHHAAAYVVSACRVRPAVLLTIDFYPAKPSQRYFKEFKHAAPKHHS